MSQVVPFDPPREFCATALPSRELVPLTPAERRVSEFLGWGWSNKEIAHALDRAEPTVKNQVASILRKTGTASRARFIVFYQTGRVRPAFSQQPVARNITPFRHPE